MKEGSDGAARPELLQVTVFPAGQRVPGLGVLACTATSPNYSAPCTMCLAGMLCSAANGAPFALVMSDG